MASDGPGLGLGSARRSTSSASSRSRLLLRGVAATTLALWGATTIAGVNAGAAKSTDAVSHEARLSPSVAHQQDAPGFPGTSTTAPFNECPAIGANSSCGLLIVVSNNGVQILGDPANAAPYDGADDTLIGIVNTSSKPVYHLQLSSPSAPIFGFEGDGICTFTAGGTSAGTSLGFTGDSYCTASQKQGSTPGQIPGTDPSGSDYQGPANTFSTITSTSETGNVNFSGGLLPGASTYFSLETTLTAGQLGVQFGYWEVASDGGIFAYDAPFYGSMGGKPLNQPVVGITADPNTGGYWEVASDGGLFAFNAPFYGSMGGKPLNKPIVAMASTPDGHGDWEIASDGGLFAFGDAQFYGSMGGKSLNEPIVGMASTPDGLGYWEVASDGGLFAFGDAQFYGSMGGKSLNLPIVGIAGDQGSGGYWEVASDGGLFSFNAPFYGSMGGKPLNKPIVGMASTPDGQGYWEVASDGGIFSYGDAFFWGSTGSMVLNAPVVGIAASQ